MTKIKILGDRITFGGHADTQRECEIITLLCDNLAKSKDFKTVKYENGYAEFEKVGNVKDVKDLMFAPGGNYMLTVNFDSHISKVSISAAGGSIECTSSGSSYDTMEYYFNSSTNPPVFTVTLDSGYILDDVSISDDGVGSVTISGNSFTGTNLCSTGNCALTITSKSQSSPTKKLKTRVQNKHDASANWAKATSFVPLAGEMIVYDDLNKVKMGDGSTTVVNLPFFINKSFDDGVLAYGDVSVYNKNDASGQYTKYKKGSITQVMPGGMGTTEYTLSLPYANGTLATTDNVVANPSGEGSTTLSKVKINNTIYNVSSGGSGSGDVTAAGNNTFTGTNTFTKAATFTSGILNNSTMAVAPSGVDPTQAAPYAIYNYNNIQLKAAGTTGTDKVRTLTLPTSVSGTLALTSDVPTKTSQLTNDSNFADKTANNVFTGQNRFSGETTISGTLNAGEAIFSDIVTINEASTFGTSPTITDTVYGDSQPGLWLQGLDNEQPRYIHLYADASEITSDYDLKIPCRDGTIATTDQIPMINTVLSSDKSNSLGVTIDTIAPQTGTNYVVSYPYKQLKTAKVIAFGSGTPNTTVALSSIVGQPTMNYAGVTEDTDSLPSNTNAIFEVYFDCWFYGTNTANIYIKSNLYGISANAGSRQATVSGYCRFGQNSFVMPISKGGSITISGDASVTSGTVTIYGYRRIR